MFIAMEISSNNVGWRPFPIKNAFHRYFYEIVSNHSCSRFQWLVQRVDHVSKHVRASILKDLLAPDTSLLTSKSEQNPPNPPNPPLVHTPRHDAESVFWLLWFLLARANPQRKGPVEKDSAEKKHYDKFCSIMLNHTVGDRVESREILAGMSIEQYRQTLHPCFSHLGDMLYYMGRYFLIDPKTWSDYEDPLGHAYYFMECLLLGEMLRNEGLKDLPLDTTRPRPATQPMAPVRSFAVPVKSRSSHTYSAALTQDSVISCSVSSSGSKRKAETDGQGSTKRRCSSPPSSHQDHAALAGAPRTGVQPEIVQPEQNPFFPTPERAEEDGRATEDENEGQFLDPDVEEANYVASQETLETSQKLEGEAFEQWSKINSSLVEAFNAASDIQESMLFGEEWFTVLTK